MKKKMPGRYLSPDQGGIMQESPEGRIFCWPGQIQDLSSIQLLRSTVDTVRQLYRCQLDMKVYEEIYALYEEGIKKTQTIHVHGYEFAVCNGGSSGYKIRLQNNEIGLIVFIKSRHAKIENTSSHIKVECSPKFLLKYAPEDAQNLMDGIAYWLSVGPIEHQGVAVHLALDFQGWQPGADFLDRLTCRARRCATRDGLDSFTFEASDVALRYGGLQSITVGSVKSLQMCLYDKTKEAHASDKLDFFRSQWEGEQSGIFQHLGGSYDPDKPVQRLEMRFHHSVLKQFERGSDVGLSNYLEAFDHLKGLWQYALDSIRLDFNTAWVDPIWCLLHDDVGFERASEKVLKRAYKTPGLGNEKNVALFLGNFVSIIARNGITVDQAWNCLKASGCWEDILGYYQNRGMSQSDLYSWLALSIKQRRLVGKAAA
ncbi:hypothetical protein [Marinobacterium arenosum]|uniref:hypothetical protein n=1 Tax=Marinobacterium arenosum TaxID=2862496 RepID=UPI001C964064|nr:hypothetical protein [Marinobacterium arenosum]MBY4675895.1 hypothetical protein [Marinobacterium arenosum]